MKREPLQLVICGSIAIDRIMNFTGSYKDVIRPEKLHALSLSVLLDQLQDSRGGVGANIAYSLALLGNKPILLGSVGKEAQSYLESLATVGVDVTAVHLSDLPIASFNVITDCDDNQVGGFYPGAMFDSDSSSFVPWAGKQALMVLSPHDPKAMRRQVEECQTHKLSLFYDVGQQVSNLEGADLAAGVQVAELLIVNDYELGVICEKTRLTERQLKNKVPVVVTTLGKEGSIISGRQVKQPIVIRAATPHSVVDPTGAGDAYRAGFLHGYVRGWDLQVCGQLGSVAAVYAVETRGTQAHKFTVSQFEARYMQNFKEEIKL